MWYVYYVLFTGHCVTLCNIVYLQMGSEVNDRLANDDEMLDQRVTVLGLKDLVERTRKLLLCVKQEQSIDTQISMGLLELGKPT